MIDRELLTPSVKTIMNAVENAGRVPVTPAGIVSVLAGTGGSASHRRVIFSDVPFRALEDAGAAAGLDAATILAAYRTARDTVGAANDELDAALTERW